MISKIRRDPNKIIHKFNIVLNNDGTVFDRTQRKQFKNITDWYNNIK